MPQLQVTLDDQQLTNQLVSRCIAGDASAWEEIVRSHNRRVYNICYRFTGSPDDAEDLAQEVFIKVYRTLKSYDLGKGAFTTWLTTVTRNLLVDHFRRSKQDRMTDSIDSSPQNDDDSPTLGEKLQDQASTPDETFATKENQQLVQEALSNLSPDLR